MRKKIFIYKLVLNTKHSTYHTLSRLRKECSEKTGLKFHRAHPKILIERAESVNRNMMLVGIYQVLSDIKTVKTLTRLQESDADELVTLEIDVGLGLNVERRADGQVITVAVHQISRIVLAAFFPTLLSPPHLT